MNRILTIVIFMICCLTLSAQSQVYKLHPVIGDTIDKYEIDKYYLFSDYTKDSIDYLILYKNKDLFTLLGFSNSTRILNIQISEDEVLSQKVQVEKLNNYYVSVLKKDSVFFNKYGNYAPISDSLDIDLNFTTPEFIKSVKKDIRRKFWDEKRKETKNNQEQGMFW